MDWDLIRLDSVDSTSSEVRRRAAEGAAEGLAVLADGQTGGRGRMGRGFSSPAGQGLYLSVLLRPRAGQRTLLWLTAWTAVAVCDAVEAVCGTRPGVKWVNDLVLNGKKLGGILAEQEGGAVILGIGLNLTQSEADFGPDLAPMAVSLAQALGAAPGRDDLAAALLEALGQMYADFPHRQAEYLARYRAGCVTLGKPVGVLRGGETREAFALALDGDYGLVVEYPDGAREAITAGEVSVRGLWGYAQ